MSRAERGEDNSLRKACSLKNFRESRQFVNRVADMVEEEDYHPDFSISWNKVTITLTTHAIGCLSEKDFIIAAKIDTITD